MKTLYMLAGLCLLALANPSFASSGSGCGVWGPVTYVYVSNSGANSTTLALINGYACFVTTTTANMSTRTPILATAMGTGKKGYLTDTEAAMNP